jgi:hypothetical protein
MKGFTAAELAEMQAADEEIDREFDAAYAHCEEQKLIDKGVDELVKIDTLDARTLHRKNKRDKYLKAYRESHKDELAAKMKAYYESHKEQLNAYQRKYYQKSKRRKQHVLSNKIQKEES